MRSIWKIQDSVSIGCLGVNIFDVTGVGKEEKMRIATSGLWHFNNSLIVTKEPRELGEIRSLKLDKAAFCFQFLMFCMNKEIALFLGKQVGEAKEIDIDDSGHYVGKYIRVWIRVDVSKSLKRAVKLTSDLAQKSIPIFLRYEKLSEFCHVCGLVEHSYCDCLSASPKEKLAANLEPKFKLLWTSSPFRWRFFYNDSYKSLPSSETPPSQPKIRKSFLTPYLS